MHCVLLEHKYIVYSGIRNTSCIPGSEIHCVFRAQKYIVHSWKYIVHSGNRNTSYIPGPGPLGRADGGLDNGWAAERGPGPMGRGPWARAHAPWPKTQLPTMLDVFFVYFYDVFLKNT